MADSEITLPEENCEYSVVLGRSLFPAGGESVDDAALEEDHNDAAHTLFQYQFTPASVDTRIPGLVGIDDSTGATVLRGTTAAAADGGITFKGKIAEQKDTECLLIFDGTSFRLERCDYVMSQLRYVRAAPLQRPPPSAYPAPIGTKNIRTALAKRTGKPAQPKGPRKAAAKGTSDAKQDHAIAVVEEEKAKAVGAKVKASEVQDEPPSRPPNAEAPLDGPDDARPIESPSSKRRRLDAESPSTPQAS